MNSVSRAIVMASGPAPFAYSDVPGQLLRLNSREGSLGFSGSVLTSVTDVSGAGAAFSLTGSPVYNPAHSGLNGAPSFAVGATSRVKCTSINRANIRFVAAVLYKPTTWHHYLWDGSLAGPSAHHMYLLSSNVVGSHTASGALAGSAAVGRKRILAAFDGATPTTLNGATSITSGIGLASGNGLLFGQAVDDTFHGVEIAFWMGCGAVPSAPIRAALETKLITDFG